MWEDDMMVMNDVHWKWFCLFKWSKKKVIIMGIE